MEPLLAIDKLNVSFARYGRTTKVLHDVSLKVGRGERVALIGQSGSGKTVTMRTIIGTLPVPPAIIESGKLYYDGRELFGLSKTERNQLKGTGISIILQDPMLSLNPVLTIERQMRDVVRYADVRLGISRGKKELKSHLIDTLAKVQLDDGERVLASHPVMLSGGMRQRVLIAMALLNKPNLLIADEPGTALDVTTQKEILNLLNQLVRDEELSLLLITHNLGVVREMADRVYVMEKGHIVEDGLREDVFKDPQHDYTKALMAAVPPLYGPKVKDIENTKPEKPLIEVKNLTKIFERSGGLFAKAKQLNAIDDLSLTINEGDIFGLAGESGSGKTTLAKMILGLHDATEGSINISDQAVSTTSQSGPGGVAFRKLMQIIYQNPGSSLNPKRTIGDQLSLPLKFSGLEPAKFGPRVTELLDMVDLPRSYSSMYPHELSGGQKQRVAIARALSVSPRILVLDEPTSALDVIVQQTIIELLTRLRQEFDLTYIFISHDLSLMRNFCNHIAIMHKGRICEHGKTRDVFANPENDYTSKLLSAIPVISEAEAAMRPQSSDAKIISEAIQL